MPNVISNSSCLIALDNIDMLFILKELYGTIYLTSEVAGEFEKDLQDWLELRQVKNTNYIRILNNIIDIGEASTIALSLEIDDSKMILDDLKARKVAKNLNLNFTGLLGVVLKAKEYRLIKSVEEIIRKLNSVNFRISKAMEEEILKLAGEN